MLYTGACPNRAHLASGASEIGLPFRAADYQGCRVFEGEGGIFTIACKRRSRLQARLLAGIVA